MAIDLVLPVRVAYLAIGASITMSYYALKGLIAKPPLLPYKHYLTYRLMWCMRAFDQHRRIRIGNQPTTTVVSYKQYTEAEDSKITYQATEVDQGAQLLWFGSKDADKVIYFLHGGAYVSPAVSGHYKLVEDLIAQAAKHGHTLGAAVLAYDLVPKGAFPKQLSQAIAGLNTLISDFNYPLSKIILMGDSAGGHLALSLLSHALHPHPDLARISSPDTTADFAGVYLLSPWVTFKQNTPSMVSNYSIDFLHKPALKIASDQFMGRAADDNYNEFLLPDASWWEGLAAKKIGITTGGYEIFRDDIVQLAKRFQKVRPDTQYIDVPGEVHDQAPISLLFGWEKCETLKVLEGWVVEACGSG